MLHLLEKNQIQLYYEKLIKKIVKIIYRKTMSCNGNSWWSKDDQKKEDLSKVRLKNWNFLLLGFNDPVKYSCIFSESR